MSNPIRQSLNKQALTVGENLVIKDRGDAPRTAVGKEFVMGEKTFELELKVKELTDKLETAGQGGERMFPLSRIHKVEGRQRLLSPAQREDLLENLRQNELDHPITLVEREDGDWNIVSGNNRYDIYLELGRTEIPGVLKQYAEDVADRQAFFSNLLNQPLPDYEKFLGFQKLMQKYCMTQDQVGGKSGINKGDLSRIMSYSKLPEQVREILNANPTVLGSRAASEFAALTEEGKGDKVLSAIQSIADGKSTQAAALLEARKIDKPVTSKPELQTYVIKSGKKKFAEMRGAKNTIRIELTNEEQRKKVEILIYDLIKTVSEG